VYEAVTTLQFSRLLFIASFCGIVDVTIPLASSTLFNCLWVFWSLYNSLKSSIKSR